MTTDFLIEKVTPGSKKAFALGVSVALSVLALTIFSGLIYFRGIVRHQMAQRDATALRATTVMEQLDVKSGLESGLDEQQLAFEAALLASRLDGVMGIRYFDQSGKFRDAFPANIRPRDLDPRVLQALSDCQPRSRFEASVPLDEILIYLPQFSTGQVARVPVMSIIVPLGGQDGRNCIGAAEFIMEGASIAQEFRSLDQNLSLLGLLAFGVSGGLLVSMLWPVFRRQQRLNADLTLRNVALERVNRELAMAVRTTALGSVSAHLIHGLKNPLASLSSYLRSHKDGMQDSDQILAHDALDAARRMQAMVDETLEILSDVRSGIGYEVTSAEIVEQVVAKVKVAADLKQVRLTYSTPDGPSLPSLVANLVRLILMNLAENAIQATPSGKVVTISAAQEADRVTFVVRDEGPGFPEQLKPGLFLPCRSAREGGGGIGLAISRQIAEHIGANLELAESTPNGCVFRLELPLAGIRISQPASGSVGEAARTGV